MEELAKCRLGQDLRSPGLLTRERETSLMVSALARVISGEVAECSDTGTGSCSSNSGGLAGDVGYFTHGATSSYNMVSGTDISF